MSGALKKTTHIRTHICYIFSMPTLLFNAGHFLSYAGHTPDMSRIVGLSGVMAGSCPDPHMIIEQCIEH